MTPERYSIDQLHEHALREAAGNPHLEYLLSCVWESLYWEYAKVAGGLLTETREHQTEGGGQ